MVTISDYIKTITKKILDSISIIENLDDNSESLEILKIELKHINGFLSIIIRKLDNRDSISDLHIILLKISKNYLDSHDFFREIEQISEIYSNDPNRIKNIKNLIIESFHKKKFLDTLNEIQLN
jgi:hypothetical protein|tara:strand:- start:1384 stop:1755 length:372 start_codon:yes stop_codon:yes gene_type:complete